MGLSSLSQTRVPDPEEDKTYNEYYESMNSYFDDLAKELDCSKGCATDVWYLRSQSRWTPELEAELIRLHKEGAPPNICEFG